MAVLMTGGGMILAKGPGELWGVVLTLFWTALAVASANTINQYLERDVDGLMARTQKRPLPSRRMNPPLALWFGIGMGIISLGMLVFVNILTAWLGAVALIMYTLIYTPLKLKTPFALMIGAIPGAMPPLMGWTAGTNAIQWPGIVLFLILFFWQLPHFLAIAIFYKDEYEKAGICTGPSVRGIRVTQLEMLVYSSLLLPISLLMVPLGFAGWIYAIVALLSGLMLVWLSFRGVLLNAGTHWARKFFVATLLYLPIITLGLFIDRILGK